MFVVLVHIAVGQSGLGRISYYEPAADMLSIMFLLGMLVARLSGTRMPRWASWLMPLALVSLVLSQRRGL